MSNIEARYKEVLDRVAQAAERAGRDPAEITVIAVSKTFDSDVVQEAFDTGIRDFGENKVQEAQAKTSLREKFPNITWHMIGHLQRNKVKQALEIFDVVQSVDSERLAAELSQRAARPVRILLEVNVSGEESKFGVPAEKTIELLKIISGFANIQVEGLMTMAPLADDPETARPYFKRLALLSQEIKQLNLPNVEMKYLSMGMTDDFEVAIQEGANMVRIGRALFGGRSG